ncbi:hypothetical protein J6590_030849 [Homalodisca vitripennis]|nr:hypothetical protein J6590_030849 [Homalodisca vitripennis]
MALPAYLSLLKPLYPPSTRPGLLPQLFLSRYFLPNRAHIPLKVFHLELRRVMFYSWLLHPIKIQTSTKSIVPRDPLLVSYPPLFWALVFFLSEGELFILDVVLHLSTSDSKTPSRLFILADRHSPENPSFPSSALHLINLPSGVSSGAPSLFEYSLLLFRCLKRLDPKVEPHLTPEFTSEMSSLGVPPNHPSQITRGGLGLRAFPRISHRKFNIYEMGGKKSRDFKRTRAQDKYFLSQIKTQGEENFSRCNTSCIS